MAGKTFTHYIAQAKRQELAEKLNHAKFVSLLMDGSTDSSNAENEIFMVVTCDTKSSDEMVHTKTEYLCVLRPSAGTASGLLECVKHALYALGTEISTAQCTKLVGFGTDGAAANISKQGLKGLVEKELKLVFWMWCLAHRLELSVKDSLTGTVFDSINEMLLRLYYIYEKSPKKCRELEDLISDLGEFISFTDKGLRPVRASGSRWISHKLSAMRRILSKYGAYTMHLAALSGDRSVRSTDRAKLQGYCKQWVDCKYVLGCALFIDLLNPCAAFS